MNTLTVALLQIASQGEDGTDQEANLAKGEAFCRLAREQGADIALFPEMWNIGYAGFCPSSDVTGDLWRAPERWPADKAARDDDYREARERWQALALPRDGAWVGRFRALARELEMAIAITYLEEWPGAPRNTVTLMDRHGEPVLTYAKIHTCDFDPKEAALTPGEDFHVATLDTAAGPVETGAMICFDREYPESARILMLRGAEIILIPNSCQMERHRIAQLETRAYENMVAVALTNYPAPHDNGHSIAFDGIAYDAHGSRDMRVIEAGEEEGVYLARFDLDAIRDHRRREVWGNAFRRPHRYGALVSEEVQPPFLRVDERGEPYPRVRR
jgi:predicted amidohydrolase